jgi:hypothetical protein
VRKLLFVSGIAALVLASTTASACGSGPTYAAKVGSTTIKQSTLDDELKAIKNNSRYKQAIEQDGSTKVDGAGKGTFNSAFVARVLTQEIIFAVVHNEVVKRGLKVTAADLAATRADVEGSTGDPSQDSQSLFKDFPKSYQDELIGRLTDAAMLEADLAGVKINDAALTDYYNKNKDSYAQTCVRHILVDTKEKADAVRARVAGGEDFAKVAQAESKDTGSGAQGGDLGCDISQFVDQFKQAATTLPVNEVSQPVQTQFGFHIIQVTSRSPKPLDAPLKGQIRNELLQPGIQKAQQLVYDQLDKSKVKVSPRIGKFQKGDQTSGQPPQVVPNEAPAGATTTVPGLPGQQPGAGAGGAAGNDPSASGSAPAAP